MIPIDSQVSRSKVKVKGHVGEGGISVSQTSIFSFVVEDFPQMHWNIATWTYRKQF